MLREAAREGKGEGETRERERRETGRQRRKHYLQMALKKQP